jgi:F-type H+-transporting ATPase subunit b
MSELFGTAEFWVAISFAAFVSMLFYFRVDKLVTAALDDRAAAIAKELEEAANLREEAQALLASYQRRQRDAEKEAEDILALARKEAELMRAEAEDVLEQQIGRRTKMAEDKIEQAEAQALKEVREVAATTATKAAHQLIKERVDKNLSDELIDKSIQDLKTKLR